MQIRMPHSVDLFRPTSSVKTDDNTSKLVYDFNTKTKSVVCMVQVQDSAQVDDAIGAVYIPTVTMWTRDTDIRVDDIINVNIEGITGKYKCRTTSPKLDSRGKFSHVHAICDKDITR